jgi:HD-GYP domain-containing protein (c-di-GMP phosphodiesterase class II)
MAKKIKFKADPEWRGSFLLALSATVFMVILSYAFASQRHFEASVIEDFQRNQLAMVSGSANAIRERLRDVKVELRERLAPDPGIMGGNKGKYSFALQWAFEELGDFVEGLYRLDTEGNVLMKYPMKKKLGSEYSPKRVPFENTPIYPGHIELETVQKGPEESYLNVTASVFKDGAPVGAVKAVVDFRTIVEEFILPLKTTPNSYGLLMDESGAIYHHPRQEYVGKTWAEVGEGDFFQRFPRRNNRVVREGYFKHQKRIATDDILLVAFNSIRIGRQSFVLTMVSPWKDIAGPLIDNKMRTWGFVGILLSIVALWTYKYNDLRNRKILLVRERELADDIIQAQRGIIFATSKLAESRDEETGEHLERVREYCRVLARRLAQISPRHAQLIDEQLIDDLFEAAPLHDIGKVGIPDAILFKPGPLTEDEYEIMKGHTIIGADMLRKVADRVPENSFLKMGIEIAQSHHERWDGTGYPDGLAGEEIPLSARILAVADVYDVLISTRHYKEAYSHELSREIILRERGMQFDPDIVDALLASVEEFTEIYERFENHDINEMATTSLSHAR